MGFENGADVCFGKRRHRILKAQALSLHVSLGALKGGVVPHLLAALGGEDEDGAFKRLASDVLQSGGTGLVAPLHVVEEQQERFVLAQLGDRVRQIGKQTLPVDGVVLIEHGADPGQGVCPHRERPHHVRFERLRLQHAEAGAPGLVRCDLQHVAFAHADAALQENHRGLNRLGKQLGELRCFLLPANEPGRMAHHGRCASGGGHRNRGLGWAAPGGQQDV